MEKIKILYQNMKNWVADLGKFRPSFSSLWRQTSFRLALIFAGLFSTFSLILLAFIYFTTVGLLSYEADQGARRELNELTRIWATENVFHLNMAVIERAATNSDSLYILIKPDGDTLSGNIDAVPMDLSKVKRPNPNTRWSELQIYGTAFTYFRSDSERQQRAARGVFIAGPDGYGLFVARDLGPGFVLAERIVNVVFIGSLAVLGFAVFGGYLTARGASRRVDELSQTAQKVMSGDLSTRAPVRIYKSGQGDEFDKLTNDLNEMLERIERLVSSSRTMGDAVAHDLRSPLARIRANLETSLLNQGNKKELQTAIDNAIIGLDQVSATFNAVLRISRLESGQGTNTEVFNLSQLLEELTEFYEPSIEDKGLEFVKNIEPKIFIRADKAMLIQAITNILENALKYTQNGKIEFVTKYLTTKEIEIAIIDSGVGIPISERENVKKRFVRLDSARSQSGTGLGLSLAQAIIDAHSGTLSLEDGIVSDAGVGLKVVLKLPNAI